MQFEEKAWKWLLLSHDGFLHARASRHKLDLPPTTTSTPYLPHHYNLSPLIKIVCALLLRSPRHQQCRSKTLRLRPPWRKGRVWAILLKQGGDDCLTLSGC